ncbi:MAG: AmmeMemoRadiSam system protein B, partial [Candidatus Eremiobacterota bacterium]
ISTRMERPVLRPLEPVPIHHLGEPLIAFRDQSGLSPGVVMVRPAAYLLLSLFDGTRTRSEALMVFQERTGASVEMEQLDGLLRDLEEALILDGPRARAALGALDERPMAHAGSAYPEDPADLARFLDDLLEKDCPPAPPGPVEGLLAPHIDLRRGSGSYSAAFNAFLQAPGEVDTFVVLGISHAMSRKPFILTRKPFRTPYGPIESDLDFIEELVAGCDFDPFTDEYNHLGEHSVEFQTTILAHLERRTGRPLKVVPVLCGSFHEGILLDRSPLALSGVPSFLTALREAVRRRAGRVCLIASADLAHKGVRFGEPPMDQPSLRMLEREDRASLRLAVEGDYEGFFATLQADRGARNYCGTSAIYTMLHCLDGRPGVLHRYDQCNEPGDASTVTVAAASYPRR